MRYGVSEFGGKACVALRDVIERVPTVLGRNVMPYAGIDGRNVPTVKCDETLSES